MMTRADFNRESELFAPVQKLNTPTAYQLFRSTFPTGYFAAVAADDALKAENDERKKIFDQWLNANPVANPIPIQGVALNRSTVGFRKPDLNSGSVRFFRKGDVLAKMGEDRRFSVLLAPDGQSFFVPKNSAKPIVTSAALGNDIPLGTLVATDTPESLTELRGIVRDHFKGDGQVVIQASVVITAASDMYELAFRQSLHAADVLLSAGLQPYQITFAPSRFTDDAGTHVDIVGVPAAIH
jgi:hypothetical protein